MSRPKDKVADLAKRARPGVRTKIYVRDDMIGGGKIDLLRTIRDTGSISAAAKEMGMGYRRAWFLLDTLQRCFAEPLVTRARGGGAGGSQVTPLGEELLKRHADHEAAVQAVSDDFIAWLDRQQPEE